ncbi:MAG: hypothetical protein B6I38_07665 [Anaerolineaceae bacterium 4572_5.1]|nr:MAG: hypothetical protein B6I38_07665 [Anaerolineaceae bacterium 4572_5.1]
MKDKTQLAKYLRYTARTILLIITALVFVFSLLSGSEEYGGGIKGILKNSPNALPWLLLFVFIYVAWKWELVGGAIVALMGVFTVFFFHSYRFPIVFFVISVPLIILGSFFIASWYLTREQPAT